MENNDSDSDLDIDYEYEYWSNKIDEVKDCIDKQGLNIMSDLAKYLINHKCKKDDHSGVDDDEECNCVALLEKFKINKKI